MGVGGGRVCGCGGGCGCAPCAALLLVLSVRILGLASNSDLDTVSHFKLQSFLLDSSRFLHYDVADGREKSVTAGVVSPLGSPVCCEFLLVWSGLHVLQSCLSMVMKGGDMMTGHRPLLHCGPSAEYSCAFRQHRLDSCRSLDARQWASPLRHDRFRLPTRFAIRRMRKNVTEDWMDEIALETRRVDAQHVRLTDVLDCVDGWCRGDVGG